MPAEREPLHRRSIEINGYRRADGCYDIEAHLVDSKSYDQVNFDRGAIAAGEPVHDMWLRLTVDDRMHIKAVQAVSDSTPYAVCPSAVPNFQRLVGLRIKSGFLREANHVVGGPVGCTHLRELLQQIATTAFQTISPDRARRELAAEAAAGGHDSDALDRRITEKWGSGKGIIDTCIAYDAAGPLVQRRWPDQYTGPETAAAAD